MVSGSLSLLSRGAFHLSLTVLYSIGHMVVFSLMRWSSLVPSGFLVSRRTPDTPRLTNFSTTGLLPCLARLSSHLRLSLSSLSGVLYPVRIATYGLGSSDFARHYFRNRFYFLFLRVIRCFSSPGSPCMTIDSSCNTVTLLTVSSLIRISAATIAHLQLTAAFRSLSRPSSAPCTKASSLRSS